MDFETASDVVERGGIVASVVGAGLVGALATYKRLYGSREGADVEGRVADLSRQINALTGRVELMEVSVRHLATGADIIALVRSLNEVDRRLAKIEGFVMGRQVLTD